MTHTGISPHAPLDNGVLTVLGPRADSVHSTHGSRRGLRRHAPQFSFTHLTGDEPVLAARGAGSSACWRWTTNRRGLWPIYLIENSPFNLGDSLIPALTMAEQDRHKGRSIKPAKISFSEVKEMLAEFPNRHWA
jgi:hypothetical protein